MRDTKAGQLGEEQLRVLDPFHRALCVAEQRPALGELAEQMGAVLEAGAADDTEGR
jgi:hypothetical protein